jgi:hypothetical protein
MQMTTGQEGPRGVNSGASEELGTEYFAFSSLFSAGKRLGSTFAKYYSDHSIVAIAEKARCEDVPEMAAIILARTQLKRGQPELAVEILEGFIGQYGETPRIKDEILRIRVALSRS